MDGGGPGTKLWVQERSGFSKGRWVSQPGGRKGFKMEIVGVRFPDPL